MDLAETLFPDPESALPVGPAPEQLEALRAELDGVVAEARSARPAPESANELAILRRLLMFGLNTQLAMGEAYFELMRSGAHSMLNEVVRRELEVTDLERKLALRPLERATHTFTTLFERFAKALTTSVSGDLSAFLTDAQARVAKEPLPPGARSIARFQLELFVALASVDAPVDELRYWTHRAVTSAHQVEALPHDELEADWLGDLARLRAKRAFRDWDADEVREEFAPWPTPDRSP